MNRLKDRNDTYRQVASSREVTLWSDGASQKARYPQGAPLRAAKQRRQLHPFFFSMGPVALCTCSVLLIGLMAVLYLSQLGQAVTANEQMQELYRQQAVLQRENQDLADIIAQEQSPEYIAEHAKSLGLVPADPANVQTLVVPHLRPIPKDDQDIQP
jgi:cell division protein FtsL